MAGFSAERRKSRKKKQANSQANSEISERAFREGSPIFLQFFLSPKKWAPFVVGTFPINETRESMRAKVWRRGKIAKAKAQKITESKRLSIQKVLFEFVDFIQFNLNIFLKNLFADTVT